MMLKISLIAAVMATGCRTSGSQTLDSTAAESGAAAPLGIQGPRSSWAVRMGLGLEDGTGGAKVKAVGPATFASAIGVNSGDVITALNGVKVASAGDFDRVAATFAANSDRAASWNGVWVLTLDSAGATKKVQPDPRFACDPYVLVGCGPFRM